ncbi:MAG: group II intron maturase-specific domain-containing protein [Planctomycetota bacterium]
MPTCIGRITSLRDADIAYSTCVKAACVKEINRRIRNWRIQLKNENTLLGFSRIFNPIPRGWYAYFGRFYPSVFGSIWNNINRYLIRWVCRKFRRFFHQKRRARRFLNRLAHAHSDLFVHWHLGVFPLG